MEVRDLFKALANFSTFNNAAIADSAGVKRPNLYSWLGGKSQSMSEDNIEKLFNILGVKKGKLSSEIVYRWQLEDSEASHIKDVLKHFLNQEYLNNAEIHFIEIEGYEAKQVAKHNLIRIPIGTHEGITILVTSNNKLNVGFPIKSSKLGFGQDKQKITVNLDQWFRWMESDTLSSAEFWIEASFYISAQHVVSTSVLNDDIDIKISYENQLIEKIAENAGLRAIIRSLIRELRLLKPKHVLLNQDNRDLIYKEYFQHEISKIRKVK